MCIRDRLICDIAMIVDLLWFWFIACSCYFRLAVYVGYFPRVYTSLIFIATPFSCIWEVGHDILALIFPLPHLFLTLQTLEITLPSAAEASQLLLYSLFKNFNKILFKFSISLDFKPSSSVIIMFRAKKAKFTTS